MITRAVQRGVATIPLNKYMVLANRRPKGFTGRWAEIAVVEHCGEYDRADYAYLHSSFGACDFTERDNKSKQVLRQFLFRDFNTCVLCFGLDPLAVHFEFLKIEEYAALVAPDAPGLGNESGVWDYDQIG